MPHARGTAKQTVNLTGQPDDLFEQVLGAAPDATIVVDMAGAIIIFNRQAEEIFGYSRDELVGQKVEILLPEALRELHVTHRAGFAEDPYRRAMGAGLELRGRRSDGSEFPVEISLSPVHARDETMVIASIRDVTEAKRLARELEESRSLFQLILEAAPDATIVVDRNGHITLANRQVETIFGYSREELIGGGVDQLLPEDLRTQHAVHRQSFAADPYRREMGQGIDLEARRADGSLFPVEISLSPLETGGQWMTIASVRDVTERRRLARELQRSNEDLRQFAYLASHDLQAPLRTVGGFTELLAHSMGRENMSEEQRALVGHIESGVSRMQQLIRDLLTYSRIDAAPVPAGRVNVGEAAAQVLPMMQSDITKFGARFTVDAPDSVVADETQFRQVLQNLFQNSLTHRSADRTPEITVTSRPQYPGKIAISVTDNGEGIPPEFRRSVFDMFKQLKSGREGTGIGLAVVKRIVERHGGSVWVEEPADHPGTRIRLTLPAATTADRGQRLDQASERTADGS